MRGMAADAPRIDVSKFSRAVTVIQPLCGDVKLPPATGFFWRYGYGHLFLVTNWHVLSGRDVETGQPRLSHGGCPDRIQINAHVFPSEPGIRFGSIYRPACSGRGGVLVGTSDAGTGGRCSRVASCRRPEIQGRRRIDRYD